MQLRFTERMNHQSLKESFEAATLSAISTTFDIPSPPPTMFTTSNIPSPSAPISTSFDIAPFNLPPFDISSPPPDGDGHGARAITVIVTLIILAVILVVSCYCGQKMKRAIVSEITAAVAPPLLPTNVIQVWEVDAPTMEKFFLELAQEKPVRFTAQQLCVFTENYTTMLGCGGFGKVYKGQFPNGVKIAVKVLNRGPNRSIEDQFMAEVGTIGRTHHINLHEECQQRIIHYDIKPANVLLDENFSPKVADFGLAKLCNREDTHVSLTGYRGTPGYLAPEFMLKNFPITYKCDVYSFGILLFEIVGRRKNTKVGGGDSESLDWFPKKVWEEFERGELMALTEACGIEEKDRCKAERMAMVALWCAQDSPEVRPPMSAVVKMLEGGVEIVPPPKPFHYLFSVGTNVLKPPSDSESGSGYTTSEGTNSYWYKETATTTIMAKYEITVATL